MRLGLEKAKCCLACCRLFATYWHKNWAGYSSWAYCLNSWQAWFSFCCLRFDSSWFAYFLKAFRAQPRLPLPRSSRSSSWMLLFVLSLSERFWRHLDCSLCFCLSCISFIDSCLLSSHFGRLAIVGHLAAGRQALRWLRCFYFMLRSVNLLRDAFTSNAFLLADRASFAGCFTFWAFSCMSHCLAPMVLLSRIELPLILCRHDQRVCCLVSAFLNLNAWVFASGWRMSHLAGSNADSRRWICWRQYFRIHYLYLRCVPADYWQPGSPLLASAAELCRCCCWSALNAFSLERFLSFVVRW